MTTGSIRGHMLRMTLMMLAGMVIQTLYSLVDIYWVSRLGPSAIAAVGVASNLMFIVIAISQALGVGAVALVSQAYGRRDEAEVQRVFNQAQSLSVLAGLLFMVVGYSAARVYVTALASDAATAALARDFLTWFIPAMALQFSMAGLGSSLRGIGNMKPGLAAQTGSVLLNMVLAPFLIFGWLGLPVLGVAGAALASFIATAVGTLGLVLYLARASTYLRVNFAQWRPHLPTWKRMLLIGLPSGAEFLMMSVILALIYAVIRPFGAEAQAGYGVAMRIMQAGFMPAVALSFAAAAVAGQNLGARRVPRVIETFVEGAKLSIGFMLLWTLLCQLFATSMVHWFSTTPGLVDIGVDYLSYVSWNYVSSGLILVSAGIFQGVGNTLPSLLASISRLLTFVAPVIWLSRRPGFKLHEVWIMSIVSVALQMLLSLTLLRRELTRKSMALATPQAVAAAA